MKFVKIKVGYLISYDYEYFFTSVKYTYQSADEIYLAIDKNYLTWSGNKFDLPSDFYTRVKAIDISNKIKFYQDSFYHPKLTPIQCDTRERKMLNKFMGGGWKIQLDSDEYMPEFDSICKYLKGYWYMTLFPNITPILFQARLITLIKQSKTGFYFVDSGESFPFATNQNDFTTARINYEIRNFNCEAYCIHQSWARPKEELDFKVSNWGHTKDFEVKEFVGLIDSIDHKNYRELKNFHPLSSFRWPELNYLPFYKIDDFIKNFSDRRSQQLKPIPNNIIISSAVRKIKRFFKLN